MKVALLRSLSKDSIDKVRKCGVTVVEGPDYSADIIFARNKLENLEKYKNLKWIQTTFSGADKFLTEEIKKSNIIVTSSKGIYNTTVSEHAMSLMLALNRGLKPSILAQQKKEWKVFDEADELYGRTVGILGVGNIGENIARLCKAFGCRVIGTSRSNKKSRYIDKMLPAARLHELLKESDYVVICLPITEGTRHLIGKKEFAMMKKSAFIINVGRGPVIDENALIDALKKGEIRGAGLDVFEEEPLPISSQLWNMENVIMTAHYAGYTPYHEERAVEIFCKNIRAFLKGKKMMNVVDKKKGY